MKLELDSDGTFWLGIWSVVCVVLCVLIMSITINSLNKTNAINDLIDKGHSPLEASCAIDNKQSDTCLILAAGK